MEVPRALWNEANREMSLRQCEWKVVALGESLDEAEVALESVLNRIGRIAKNVPSNDPLRPCVDILLAKCPRDVSDSGGRPENVNYDALVAVHDELNSAVSNVKRSRVGRGGGSKPPARRGGRSDPLRSFKFQRK